MSALIEKDIEESVAALLRSRLHSVRIGTTWEQSPAGEVKGEEHVEDDAVIAVAASAPQWDAWLVPACTVAVALAVSVRREVAPDAAALAAIMEPISNLLIALQLDVAACEPLSSQNFSCDGVRSDGGPPPTFVDKSNVWRVARSLTLRGVVVQ